MRLAWLVVLVACGPSNVIRKKDGTFEMRGKIMRRVQHCGHVATATPYGHGKIVISSAGKTIAEPEADEYGKFMVTLPPGEYCLREPSAQDCFTRWVLPVEGDPTKVESEIMINDYDMKNCN